MLYAYAYVQFENCLADPCHFSRSCQTNEMSRSDITIANNDVPTYLKFVMDIYIFDYFLIKYITGIQCIFLEAKKYPLTLSCLFDRQDYTHEYVSRWQNNNIKKVIGIARQYIYLCRWRVYIYIYDTRTYWDY